MSMFKNITDDKVDFYCDNRLAAVEDLDFVLSELKETVAAVSIISIDAEPAFVRLEELIGRFEDKEEPEDKRRHIDDI